ncbi:MAG: hypothetical protein FJX77_11040 [Armatimonadetes bacterium]|nr:hypothetical protein [Armatimonadota bacterium]
MVFARSGYTDPAKVLARFIAPLSVLLWEFRELELAMEKNRLREGLAIKYRYAVEQGMPDYIVEEELT